jgi:hypothetical protein
VREPLPVDVVSSWWDYLVDAASLVAGLGTLGALIVAVVVFRRQVEDSRSAQASQVVVSVSTDVEDHTGTSAVPKLVVENKSNLPIFKLTIYVSLPRKRPHVVKRVGRLAGRDVYWMHINQPVNAEDVDADVIFDDAAGHGWARSSNGALVRQRSNPQGGSGLFGPPREPRTPD